MKMYSKESFISTTFKKFHFIFSYCNAVCFYYYFNYFIETNELVSNQILFFSPWIWSPTLKQTCHTFLPWFAVFGFFSWWSYKSITWYLQILPLRFSFWLSVFSFLSFPPQVLRSQCFFPVQHVWVCVCVWFTAVYIAHSGWALFNKTNLWDSGISKAYKLWMKAEAKLIKL